MEVRIRNDAGSGRNLDLQFVVDLERGHYRIISARDKGDRGLSNMEVITCNFKQMESKARRRRHYHPVLNYLNSPS